MSKLCSAVILVSLAFSLVSAQDATKVEPKHYRLAFENEKVQVVYIHYGPHEKSKMHSHPEGVVVDLTESHLRFTDQDGKTQDVYSKAGEARWFPPFRHTVENLGNESFSGIYIGLKGGPTAAGTAQPGQRDAQSAKVLAAYLLQQLPVADSKK
jgi:quercetin dioxygenase-like cupin family protein